MEHQPPLKRMHSAELLKGKQYGHRYRYLSKHTTREIVESLAPSNDPDAEPLVVDKAGLVWQGNTRVLILEERGFDVNSLPRTPKEE